MRVEPSGAELLRAARETLLEELLPLLPEGGLYSARMIANAMAIAGRELAHAEVSVPLTLAPSLAELAAAIRAGRFDSGSARDALAAYLRETTRERLAVSNPRILSATKP